MRTVVPILAGLLLLACGEPPAAPAATSPEEPPAPAPASEGEAGPSEGAEGLGLTGTGQNDPNRLPMVNGRAVVPSGPHPTFAFTPGALEVGEGLDEATVGRHLGSVRGQVRYCLSQLYGDGEDAQPDAEGEVALRLTVAPTGAVAGASASSERYIPPSVSACLVRYARTWELPAPEPPRVTTVTQTYRYAPPSE